MLEFDDVSLVSLYDNCFQVGFFAFASFFAFFFRLVMVFVVFCLFLSFFSICMSATLVLRTGNKRIIIVMIMRVMRMKRMRENKKIFLF